MEVNRKTIKKVLTFCRICGKEFYKRPSELKRGLGKFCSTECLHKWQSQNLSGKNSPNWKGGEIERICLFCSKKFHIRPSQIKRGRGRFCSRRCQHRWQSQNWKGKNSPKWRRVKRICQTCKKEFLTHPAWIKRGDGKFCSLKCFGIWNIRHMKKKDTLIELVIEKQLLKMSIPYIKQYPIKGIALADFLLPNKIIIQCDGTYWHSLPKMQEKDKIQNILLKSEGYKVFRFSEDRIKKSAENCISSIFADKTLSQIAQDERL